MAYSNSLIGYAAKTLTAPTAPAYRDSLVGYATALLSPPAPVGVRDSPVGYASATLTAPVAPFRFYVNGAWRAATLVRL